MKKINFVFLASGALFIALWTVSCSNNQRSGEETTASQPVSQEDIVKRGEYLVTIMGCNDCHSPKKMGPNGAEIIPELMLSGYPSDRPIVKFSKQFVIFTIGRS